VKQRQLGAAIANPNAVDRLDVKWDSTGEQFGDEYEGLLARWVETSRLIWVNGTHQHLQQLVHDAIRTRRASGEKESIKRVHCGNERRRRSDPVEASNPHHDR
jgi:hypothetical protein